MQHMAITALLLIMLPIETLTQISVDVQIASPNGQPPPTLSMQAINQAAASEKIQGVQGVSAPTVETQLSAEMCQPGTYSGNLVSGSVTIQTCISCPAGTASAARGASDPSTCAICPTGAYAATGSSVCTNCPANTFSVTPQAASSAVCIACPGNTTSVAGSDAIEKCLCNSTFFPSNNILSAANGLTFDTVITTLAFIGAAAIDTPHVTCSL